MLLWGNLQALRQAAAQRGDWQAVQALFASYSGHAVAIFTTVMNAAFRCRQYRFGAQAYEKFCSIGQKDAPVYTLAVKTYAKLGRMDRVREIWDEARSSCKLNEALAGARIDAAADEGDVDTAASILDELVKEKSCQVDLGHFTSAIHACAMAERPSHNAALYLFNCMLKMGIEPDVAVFSALVGAYQTAPLHLLLQAYESMKSRAIAPNQVFAEVYLTRLLQIPKDDWKRTAKDLAQELCALPRERVRAARAALAHFHHAEVVLSNFCQIMDEALNRRL